MDPTLPANSLRCSANERVEKQKPHWKIELPRGYSRVWHSAVKANPKRRKYLLEASFSICSHPMRRAAPCPKKLRSNALV
jgi:hypothetical protein